MNPVMIAKIPVRISMKPTSRRGLGALPLYNSSNCQHGMETSQLRPSWLLRSLTLILFSTIIMPVNGLYFYLDGLSPKCFYEELPKDTLVVGQSFYIVLNGGRRNT